MKIAFPAQKDHGMESAVYGHFGSAPLFIIVETTSGTCESVANLNREHLPGQCQALAALGGRVIDAVAVGGIGDGALRELNMAGIKTYRAIEGTVAENFRLIESGLLPFFTLEQTCAGHRSGETCPH